jgi:hypothetical protein
MLSHLQGLSISFYQWSKVEGRESSIVKINKEGGVRVRDEVRKARRREGRDRRG